MATRGPPGSTVRIGSGVWRTRATSPVAESVVAPADPGARALDVDGRPEVPSGFDRYEIVGEQGRGGLGRVLRARDKKLGRLVALKELHDVTPEAASRFLREVMLTARLQHPSIVGVYEVGEKDDGSPFYAMKLVEGKPLEKCIAEQTSFAGRLTLLPHVTRVAEAIAYAHERGIIHRDLKPANVIVGAFGETVVIDWGLAKELRQPMSEADVRPPSSAEPGPADDDLGKTNDGELLGTPAYMPPEQMRGEQVDERADVFALGGLLYHVLSGKPPYGEGTFREVVARIGAGEPRPLGECEPQVPSELLTIVKKAMAKDRSDRYPSANELAAELQRYQTGHLVSAHRYTLAALARRFVRKNRAPVLVGAAFALALALFAVFSFGRIVRERDRAEHERSEAQARALELTMLQARSALERDPSETVAWLKTYPTTGAEWSSVPGVLAIAERRGVARYVRNAFPSRIRSLALSHDGKLAVASDDMRGLAVLDLATGVIVARYTHPGIARKVAFARNDTVIVAGGEDGTLILFDYPRAKTPPRKLPAHRSSVRALAVSPDGRVVATGGEDHTVVAWDIDSGESRLLGAHDASVEDLVFSPDGTTIATVGADAKLRLFRASGGAIATYAEHEGTLRTRVAFSGDGRFVVALEPNETLSRIDVRTGARASFCCHEGMVGGIAVSASGDTIASAGFDHTVRLWDAATGKARVLVGHASDIEVVTFSPDGKQLASAGVGGDVFLWDVATGKCLRHLRGHTHVVEQLVFSTALPVLVSSDHGGEVRVWDVTPDPHVVLSGHTHDVTAIAFSPSGRFLATGSHDKTARLWDLRAGTSRVLSGHGEHVRYVAFDGEQDVFTGSWDRTARSWSAVDGSPANGRIVMTHDRQLSGLAVTPHGELITASQGGELGITDRSGQSTVLRGHVGGVREVAVSADGLLAASAGEDHTVRLWDVAKRAALVVLVGHEGAVTPLAFSADGRWLASGSKDTTVRVWDVRDARRSGSAERRIGPMLTLRGHTRTMNAVAFSPDGNLLVSGSSDHTARIWDLRVPVEGEVKSTVLEHGDTVGAVAFSPDGAFIATGSNDRGVRVWDASGRLRALHEHDNLVMEVAFSPDGKVLASAGWDQVARLWPLDPARMLPTDTAGLRGYLERLTDRAVPAAKR